MTVQSVAPTFVQCRAQACGPTGPALAAGESDAATSPVETAAASSVVTLQHVVVNATSVTYQSLGARAVPTAGDATPATAVATSVDSPVNQTLAAPAIARLDPNDFATLRARSLDVGKQVALSLDLTTQDGDAIHLDFSQIDTFERVSVDGRTTDGTAVRARAATASSERHVSMRLDGNLSDDEKRAIDAVLQSVIDVANEFFHGDVRAAVAHLADMNVDTNQLAQVSLQMSTNRSQQLASVATGAGARIRQAAQSSGGVARMLQFLADRQRQLITAAKAQFDDRSAVRMVTQLLPAMIAPAAPVETGSADAAPDSTPAVVTAA
jgi:hypothetical protein